MAKEVNLEVPVADHRPCAEAPACLLCTSAAILSALPSALCGPQVVWVQLTSGVRLRNGLATQPLAHRDFQFIPSRAQGLGQGWDAP